MDQALFGERLQLPARPDCACQRFAQSGHPLGLARLPSVEGVVIWRTRYPLAPPALLGIHHLPPVFRAGGASQAEQTPVGGNRPRRAVEGAHHALAHVDLGRQEVPADPGQENRGRAVDEALGGHEHPARQRGSGHLQRHQRTGHSGPPRIDVEVEQSRQQRGVRGDLDRVIRIVSARLLVQTVRRGQDGAVGTQRHHPHGEGRGEGSRRMLPRVGGETFRQHREGIDHRLVSARGCGFVAAPFAGGAKRRADGHRAVEPEPDDGNHGGGVGPPGVGSPAGCGSASVLPCR